MTFLSEANARSALAVWMMNDASGSTTVADSSGNNRHLTVVGTPTLGAATVMPTGSASIDFSTNSVANRLTLASAAWMQVPSFSVVAWIRASAVNSYRCIWSRDGSSGSRGPSFYVTNGKLNVVVSSDSLATTTLATGTDYFVGFSYNNATTTLTYYVNGVADGSLTVSKPNNLANDITIAASRAGTASQNFPWWGRSGPIAYFGTALSGADHAALYAAGVSSASTINGGQATETNTALAGVVLAGAVLLGGQATETDTALAGTIAQGQTITGGQATETDEALPGTVDVGTDPGLLLGGQAVESDTALPGSIVLGYAATDTTNRVGGRRRGGYATVTWEPPVADPPTTLVFGDAYDVAISHGPVTMNGTQPEYTTDTARRTKHRDRILFGGHDITYLRGVQTPLPSHQLVSPLMYGPGTLTLPQINPMFERIGSGDHTWLQLGKRVVIQRVDAETGDVVATDYRGVALAFDPSGDQLTVGLGGEAAGRAALMWKQIPIFRSTNDGGTYLARAIRGLGLQHDPPLGADTGILIGRFGGTGWLDYISQITGRLWTRSGNQWTVMPKGDGVYHTFRKDTTTIHATAYLDGAGVTSDLRRDISQEPNRWYATLITKDGAREQFAAFPGMEQGPPAPYPFDDNRTFDAGTTNEDTDTGDGIAVMIDALRIARYMNEAEATGGFDSDVVAAIKQLQEDAGLIESGDMNPGTWRALYNLDVVDFSLRQSEILPVAQRSSVRQWIRSANGSIMRANRDYDKHRLKVDINYDLGSGLETQQGREFVFAEKEAREDNWVGTLRFFAGKDGAVALVAGDHTPGTPIGPSDVFRARALRPGMNLRIPHGPAGNIVVHVSAVSIAQDGSVSADVDTRARDSMQVWEIIDRNREGRVDPKKQFIREHRASGQIKDAIDGWWRQGGLLGNKVTVPGKQWTVFPVIAGQEGTIARLAMNTAPNAEFVVAVFGRKIGGKYLAWAIGNPLTKKGAKNWASENIRNKLDASHLLLYVAGDSEQPCGYFPRSKRPDTVVTDEPNPDYDPDADLDSVGTDDEPTVEVETETGSITPLTGRMRDDAGFGFRTFSQPVLYVAVFADRDTSVPAGRIMWPQLEAGA